MTAPTELEMTDTRDTSLISSLPSVKSWEPTSMSMLQGTANTGAPMRLDAGPVS